MLFEDRSQLVRQCPGTRVAAFGGIVDLLCRTARTSMYPGYYVLPERVPYKLAITKTDLLTASTGQSDR